MSEQIRRVAVWSGWLRFTHGALALATLVLMATGWLIANSPMLAGSAADVHYLAASLLIAVLLLRLLLGLFGKGAERFEHMVPRTTELGSMRASLLFYLTLGKAPLPNWFAHNPLWKPLYLVLFVLLALLALSGWLMPEVPVLGRVYLPRLHVWLSNMVWALVLAHLFSVLLQDTKGQAADVSAMLNGHRYFNVERDTGPKPKTKPVSIKLDDFGKR